MKKLKRYLRILGFVCLLLLALAGVGIPIPMFPEVRFSDKNKIELVEEKKED